LPPIARYLPFAEDSSVPYTSLILLLKKGFDGFEISIVFKKLEAEQELLSVSRLMI
jgi:hypothetical protein